MRTPILGLSVLSLSALAGSARADVLAHWALVSYPPPNNAQALAPLPVNSTLANVSASAITGGAGLVSLDVCGPTLSATGCAGTGQLFTQYYSTQFDENDYYQFSVTAAPGHAITYQSLVTGLGIRYIRDGINTSEGSSSGARTWQLRYSLDGFATPGTTVSTINPFPMSGAVFPGQLRLYTDEMTVNFSLGAVGTRSGTVTFRLYGYNPLMGHSSTPLGLGGGLCHSALNPFSQDMRINGLVQQVLCYADCNGDGALNLADFGCFQTRFALGDMYCDCNGDAVLNLADFGCFQTRFATGCP